MTKRVRNRPLFRLLLLACLPLLIWVVRPHIGQAAAPLITRQGEAGGLKFALAGCQMAHCDRAMSDIVGLPAPPAGSDIIWHDPTEAAPGFPIGSAQGLGCVSNGSTAACTLGRLSSGFPQTACDLSMSDTLIAYDYAGPDGLPARRWSSGDLLNCTALTSAPIILGNGDVVAADNQHLIRFSSSGAVIWQTPIAGGVPISPVPVGGAIVLATSRGPVSLYGGTTGVLIQALNFDVDGGRFFTVNTPAVRGNRLYIVMHHSLDKTWGRLYAVDVVRPPGKNAPQLQVAWFLELGGPAGGSPLVLGTDMVYFDAARAERGGEEMPLAIAVRDLGDHGEVAWTSPLPGIVGASFAADPRGGLWLFTTGYPADNSHLRRYFAQDQNGDGFGDVQEEIDVDQVVAEDGVHVPNSILSIAGDAGAPVMLFNASAYFSGGALRSSFILALDLAAGTVRWKLPLPGPSITAGQFAVMTGPYGPRAIFTNRDDGTWVIGLPVTR